MSLFMQNANQAVLIVSIVLLILGCASAQKFGEAKLVYEWDLLEFDWPSESVKQEAIRNGTYRPERNMLAGIKVYKGIVYLTIPRWFWTSGQPVTLAKVVSFGNETKLRPYPNWAAQKQGDCNALQYVQGLEIDSNTGLMYVIDTGRVGNSSNLCPAKIVVYDLKTDTEKDKYEIPEDVASNSSNFLNDIVLDYVNGTVRYAYVTNTNQNRLVIYDFETHSAHYFDDLSMKVEANNASVFNINNKSSSISVAIDGITMSYDFKYVYFCVLSGYNLYQVPTSTLRKPSSPDGNGVRLVGRKVSQTDGLAHGNKRLYYGALGLNAVYYWDTERDLAAQKVGMDQVTLASQVELVSDNATMQWADTFGFDEQGWIWFISNRLQDFINSSGIIQGEEPYMRVWKVYVNETSYLYQADKRTLVENSGSVGLPSVNGSARIVCTEILLLIIFAWVTQNIAVM